MVVVVVDVVVVVALAVADEDHLGHGHMYGHDLLRPWRDQGFSWTISRVDCGCYV